MAHFSIQGLTFSYPDRARPTLEDVSLDVERGQFCVLCGKSGCGKTTLLRHLKSVLAPHGQVHGQVLFDGVPLEQVDQRTQSAEIGFVMQNPDAQVVTDKVWHELAFGLESLGTDQSTMRLRVAEMASYFGIQSWFEKDVGDLSGGQKQLLSLASIMAMRPSVLILDEPTSQLDPIAASDFLNTVRKINTELGTTVILTEHRLEDIYAFADQVAVMDKGRLVAQGAPRDVGEALFASSHDMVYALPAPMRIFYGVAAGEAGRVGSRVETGALGSESGAPDGIVAACAGGGEGALDSGGAGSVLHDVPLTVREGRTWLSVRYPDGAPQVRGAKQSPDSAPDRAQAAVLEGGTEGNAAVDYAVEVDEVWFRYDRDLPDVLKGISLAVPAASTYALVGGNGVGKSTLLKVLCASVKPYRGTVRLLGRTTANWKTSELFSGALSMLPQDPANLFATKSVRGELEEMLDGPLDDTANQERIAQIAETCDIVHLLDAHPLDLSGGEQQRAALAKVLMCEPRVLLLDEPTKGIDNFFKRRLAGVLDALKAEGRTIVMVSHDVEFCARYADEVAMLFNGAVSATGTPRQFFSQASFYTTAANRMSRHVFEGAITEEDVVQLCLK